MTVTDPDAAPELLCEGRFNVSITQTGIATLTFTHAQTPPDILFQSRTEPEYIVRARISMSISSLLQLREALNGLEFGAPAVPRQLSS